MIFTGECFINLSGDSSSKVNCNYSQCEETELMKENFDIIILLKHFFSGNLTTWSIGVYFCRIHWGS
jgi:hypothetical protein